MRTLVDLLQLRAGDPPGVSGLLFLGDGESETARLSWADLDREARAIARALRQAVPPGERALLLHPPGPELVAAFFGCLYAGVVAVPSYPPLRARGTARPRALPRLRAMAADCKPALALITQTLLPPLQDLAARLPELSSTRCLATDGLPGATDPYPLSPDALAFLQYTSGSTDTPRGVEITHANALHNQHLIQEAFRLSARSIIVSWLPLYHDMGLIGTLLQPLFLDARCILMPPSSFLQRPARWLEAISRYGATVSGGPNFAYDLCVRSIPPDERSHLDLSTWTVAYNGAEPVHPDTLDRFSTAFAPAGFQRQAFHPCYGLAEATLIVSGAPPATVLTLQAPSLESGRLVVATTACTASETDASAERLAAPSGAHTKERSGGEPSRAHRRIAGSGRTLSGAAIRIVDPATAQECPPDRIGEIWVAGPSVARGCWNRPDETARLFNARLATGEGPFLRTGDLGFLDGGELFVTGRIKDLIVVRGRNLYPQDVERVVEETRPGRATAFATERDGEERLTVVQEVDHRFRSEPLSEWIAAARQAVMEELDVQLHALVLVPQGSTPVTSSGKVRRGACRAALLAGELTILASAGWDAGEAPDAAPTVDTLRRIPGEERRAAIEAWLRRWTARLLGIPPGDLNPERTLAELGLDSMGALELRNALESTLGARVRLANLLQEAKLAGVAELAAAALERELEPEAPIPAAGAGEHPLTAGQKALWLLHRVQPESAAYNVAFAGRVEGGFDPDTLRQSLRGWIERHPVLRTTYGLRDGEPFQLVRAAADDPLAVINAAAWSEAELARRMEEEAWRPFDLQSGPVLRVLLFQREDGCHVLLLAAHHIAVDFWSLVLLADELRQPKAIPPPTDVAGFARWQAARLAGPAGEALLAPWRERLAGCPAALPLPVDGTARGEAAASHPFSIDSRFGALAALEGATPFVVLLAAFQALLHRYTGMDDLVVGAPLAARTRPELEEVVGYFANTLPLRGDLSGDPSFRELIGRARRVTLEALAHQDLPFAVLVERLSPERREGRTPFFQVVMALEKPQHRFGGEVAPFVLGREGGRVDLGGLRLVSAALPRRAVPFELVLKLVESRDGYAAAFDFDAGRFDAATVARLARGFELLLGAAVEAPGRRVSELPVLDEAERSQLLLEWSGGLSTVPAETIDGRFEEQARRTPGAVALLVPGVEGEESWTYAELSARSSRCARRLLALGLRPEEPVGILMERTRERIAAALGVLKAGGAYLPLDPEHPPARLRALLAEAGVRFVLADETRAVLVSEWHGEILAFPAEGGPPAEAPPSLSSPDSLAYILYTSGSTGAPRGVAVPHRAVVRLARDSEWAAFGPGEVWLHLAPFAFDASTLEIWGPLLNGGRLVLFPPGIPSLAGVGETIRRHGITSLWLTAGLFHRLADSRPADLRPLRRLLAGGDALSAPQVRRALAEMAPAGGVLVDGYGPTEGTTFTSCHVMSDPAAVPDRVPIGRPVAGTRVYVLGTGLDTWLDTALRPVPPGVPGELFAAGVGLARGYLGRPEATAERFLPDPFGALFGEPGARLYRTGDRARWRQDGRLEFLGRIDRQVKIRGYRVEPGEVEAALVRLPGVREAAVVVLEERGERRLIAYVVGEEGGRADLLSVLRGILPESMIPADVVFLPALPLTARGKVDLSALPAPARRSAVGERPRSDPRTEIERRIADIWRELLGVESVSLGESFFALGGHSLLLVEAHERLRRELGREVPMADLFAHPTVASLAAHLSREPAQACGAAVHDRAADRRERLARQLQERRR